MATRSPAMPRPRSASCSPSARARFEGLASTLIPKPALLRKRLEMTGKDITLGKYAMVCLGICRRRGVGLMVQGAPFFLAFFIGLFFGIGGPHFIIGKMIKRRVNKFNVELPRRDRADGPRSAFGPSDHRDAGHRRREIPGPVGIEFRMVADKMKIGRTMEAALQETADRLGTPEFQFFVITLAIQRETGGNLAETLSNLADVLRKRAQMKLKIRAMSSESKASAYIVGSLPFIVFASRVDDEPRIHGRLLHRSATDRRRESAAWCGWALVPSSWPKWSTSRSEGRVIHAGRTAPPFSASMSSGSRRCSAPSRPSR